MDIMVDEASDRSWISVGDRNQARKIRRGDWADSEMMTVVPTTDES